MSRVCQITGRKTQSGNSYARRGLAKYKGGVGKKTTGITHRKFKINLQWRLLWVPELKRRVRVRLSTRALRTLTRNGVYQGLLQAGLVAQPRSRKHKKGTAPVAP